MHIEEKKVAVLTEPKTTHFDSTEFFGNNLQHAIDSVIKYNERLAEHTVKNNISQPLSKYKHGNDTHKHGKQ